MKYWSFLNKGMAEARLEILGLAAPLGLFTVYHDDGFVDSVQKHLENLNDRYCSFNDLGIVEGGYSVSGKAAGTHVRYRKNLFWVHHHICYRDFGNEADNTAIRAHEETHFLDASRNLAALAERISAEHGLKIRFRGLKKEVRAYIGSVHALASRGMSADEFQKGICNAEYEAYFRAARKAFQPGV